MGDFISAAALFSLLYLCENPVTLQVIISHKWHFAVNHLLHKWPKQHLHCNSRSAIQEEQLVTRLDYMGHYYFCCKTGRPVEVITVPKKIPQDPP